MFSHLFHAVWDMLALLGFILFVFQDARVLAAFVNPNHLVWLSSWGFTALPPTCILKSIEYKPGCESR